jgi:hypothetical protein
MTLNILRRFWWDGNLVIVGDVRIGKAINVSKFISIPIITAKKYNS